jgi:hypothetical protein
MHIRDESIRGQAKQRLKREFATRAAKPAPESTAPGSEPIPLTASPPSDQALPADPPSNSNIDPALREPSRGGLREIAGQHARMATEDDHDCEAVLAPSTIGGPVKIADLFDFSQQHWVVMYSQAAHRSFEEELELYEILDLDGEGDANVDIDVDGMTGDILLN